MCRRVFTMVGVPGSGKSTLAKKFASISGAVVVSTDDIRERLFGDANDQSNGGLVFSIAYKEVENALNKGYDVYFDAMNVKRSARKEIIKKFPNSDHVAVVVDTPLDLCLERNRSRERVVPEEVIRRNYNILRDQYPSKSEGYAEIYRC